jgi:SOS-response transcriptional repressor LexA
MNAQPTKECKKPTWQSVKGTRWPLRHSGRRTAMSWLVPHNPAFTPLPGDKAKIISKTVTVLCRV